MLLTVRRRIMRAQFAAAGVDACYIFSHQSVTNSMCVPAPVTTGTGTGTRTGSGTGVSVIQCVYAVRTRIAILLSILVKTKVFGIDRHAPGLIFLGTVWMRQLL